MDKGFNKFSNQICVLVSWHICIPTTSLDGTFLQTSLGEIHNSSLRGNLCAFKSGYTYGVICLENNSLLDNTLVNLGLPSLLINFPFFPPQEVQLPLSVHHEYKISIHTRI